MFWWNLLINVRFPFTLIPLLLCIASVSESWVSGVEYVHEELQGLREENALLKAHLRRLAEAQEALIPHVPDSEKPARREAMTTMRFPSHTTACLANLHCSHNNN